MLDKSFSMHENEQLEISKRAIEVLLHQFAGAWDKIGRCGAFGMEEPVPAVVTKKGGGRDFKPQRLRL